MLDVVDQKGRSHINSPSSRALPRSVCLHRPLTQHNRDSNQLAPIESGSLMSPSPPTGFIETVRKFIPVANYRAEVKVNSNNVNVGTVFKAIVAKLPNSEATVDGSDLVISNLHRSLKLGFLDFFPNSVFDIDRRLWDTTARFSVTKVGDQTTITAAIHQAWTRLAAQLILFVPFMGLALMVNVLFRTKLFLNRRIRSAVQRILDDLAKEIERNATIEKLNSSFDKSS